MAGCHEEIGVAKKTDRTSLWNHERMESETVWEEWERGYWLDWMTLFTHPCHFKWSVERREEVITEYETSVFERHSTSCSVPAPSYNSSAYLDYSHLEENCVLSTLEKGWDDHAHNAARVITDNALILNSSWIHKSSNDGNEGGSDFRFYAWCSN